MKRELVRALAISDVEDGKFRLKVITPTNELYYLVMGSCNPDVNERAQGKGKRRPYRPVNERTPAMQDMRALRCLQDGVLTEAYRGLLIEPVDQYEIDNREDGTTVYEYRTVNEYLHDLEHCNCIGEMLSNPDNFLLLKQ